ncbi:hypothetical protein KY362_00965, partial [Candidatus Woesearchaeota archaeon]|nr:hypothetical protein [Candidatus Woesearchaeota archaeon]
MRDNISRERATMNNKAFIGIAILALMALFLMACGEQAGQAYKRFSFSRTATISDTSTRPALSKYCTTYEKMYCELSSTG